MSEPFAPPPPPPPIAPPTAPAGGKADLGTRFLAALIDGVLCAGVSMIPFVGGIVAAAYMLVRDGLEVEFADRRSIGKKLMKLRPLRLDGAPMDLATSAKRNLPFVVGWIGMPFLIIPVLGWLVAILLAVVGTLVGLVEIFLVLTDGEGRRMGDKFAETKVVQVAD